MYTSSRFSVHPVALVAVLLFTAGALANCGPTISRFNETAYQQATSLKVESLKLMESATEPYDEHADSVRALKKELKKAHEYAKGRPNNKISAKQWKTLIDTSGSLLGGFLERWKDSPTPMNDSLVVLKQEQVAEAFDTIIELESGKIKPENAQVGQ